MKNYSNRESIFFALGLIFILSGLICNEWVLTALLSSDGNISFSKKVVVRIFDLFIIIAGLFIIIKRASLSIKRLLLNLISICLIILLTETGLQGVHFVLQLGKQEELSDKRYLLPVYKDKIWAKDIYRELDALSGDYKEYRGWGKKEFHGKHLNINADGVRKTWNPTSLNVKEADKMYIFGPSSIWGDGTRDDHTVPSYISKQLYDKNYSFIVSNYGEWSYTFTQGLVYLILLLRDGHRPDYVVFYDGIDVYNSYQSGKPGTLHFSFLFREKGEKLTNMQHIGTGLTNAVKEDSMIYRELTKLFNKIDPPEIQFPETGHRFNDAELYELSQDIVEYLSKSVNLLENLSKLYGFKYMFFWPPVLYTEDKVLDEEIGLDFRLKDEKLLKVFRYTDDILRTGKFDHFYNISDIFKNRTRTYYLDFGHTSEEGNEIIAKKIVSIFENEYLSEKAGGK